MFLDLVHSNEFYIGSKVTVTRESKIWDELELGEIGEKLKFVVFADGLSPEQYKLVTAHCTNLTHVRIRRNLLQIICVKSLLQIIKKVVWLDVSDTFVCSFSFWDESQLFHTLRSLGFANIHLSDFALRKMTELCPRIAHLDISCNSKLTDSGILSMLVNLKALRGLNIKECSDLTDASLVYIATHCARTLHTLQMNCYSKTEKRNPVFSTAAINALLVGCTQLRTLHFSGCASSQTGNLQTSPNTMGNLTTLVLGTPDYIDCLITLCKLCPYVRTIVTEEFYSPDNLASLARCTSNLKEVHMMAQNKYKVYFGAAVRYAKDCTSKVQTIRPGLVVKCIYTENDYSVHDVMSM